MAQNIALNGGGLGGFGIIGGQEQGDWHSMESAPRDGTIIEVRCTYGVAPWYGIFRWTDEMSYQNQDGTTTKLKGEPRWTKVGDDASGFTEDGTFTWRPYRNDGAAYVDPTGGFQNDPRYWRQAVSRKYGLPLDHFEPKKSILDRVKSFLVD